MNSPRKRKWLKTLKYKLAEPVLGLYLKLIWTTVKIDVQGQQHILDLEQACIPCYWHQQNIGCAIYLLRLKKPGFKPGFLVSPSRDGEVASQAFAKWGAHIVRGSSSRTGAQALRDLYQIIKQEGVSPANTPDGPRGPIFEFKPGALMLAQMTQAPILPLAYAARDSWQLNSWDNFILPKPFTRLTIVIGEPCYIKKGLSLSEMEPTRQKIQTTLKQLSESAQLAAKK